MESLKVKENNVLPEINFPVHEQDISPSRDEKDHSDLSRKKSVKKTPSFRNNKIQENAVAAGKIDRKTTLNQQNCEVNIINKFFLIKTINVIFIHFLLIFLERNSEMISKWMN